MEDLRGILTIIGIGIVALVYWYSRREQQRKIPPIAPQIEPELGTESFGESPMAAPLGDGAVDAGEDSEPEQPVPEKVITIRLVAGDSGTISGEKLVLALRGLGLQHGKFGIFHRMDGSADATVFSVANLVEPGTFDLASIGEQDLPGVSFFMVLPGPASGVLAFDQMVETARTLARTVDGEVLDSAGSGLSIQRERFIREEIIQYEHGTYPG